MCQRSFFIRNGQIFLNFFFTPKTGNFLNQMLTEKFEDRLSILIHLSELSNNEFAKSINESRSQISKYLNNHGKPGYDTLISILKKFPDLNARWLLMGEPPMFLSHINVEDQPDKIRTLSVNRVMEMFKILMTYHNEVENKLLECETVFNAFKQELIENA